MKIPVYLLCLLLGISLLTTSSCNKDKDIPNEVELITTIHYMLYPVNEGTRGGGFYFQDLDGAGGNAPEIEGATLSANTVYTGELSILNKTVNLVDGNTVSLVEDVHGDVLEEAEDHQLFFSATGIELDMVYNDTDANKHPLGLKTTLKTKGAGSGTFTITLRHQPDKSAEGVAAGSIENAGGETDIEITFPIEVQ